MEELARTLKEEEEVSYLQDTSTSIITTTAIPSAPPPDIVTGLSIHTEDTPDTSQLVRTHRKGYFSTILFQIEDNNPDAVRRLSTEVAVVNLVVNLPPDSGH